MNQDLSPCKNAYRGGGMADENLADLYGRASHAVQALHTRAAEILALTQRLEARTKDTLA